MGITSCNIQHAGPEEEDVWAICARAIAVARVKDPQDLAGRRGDLAELLFAPLLPSSQYSTPSMVAQIPMEKSKKADAPKAHPISIGRLPPMPCAGATPISRPAMPSPRPVQKKRKELTGTIVDTDDVVALQSLKQRMLALQKAIQCLLALTYDGPELDDDHQVLHAFNALQALEGAMVSDHDDVDVDAADCIKVMEDMLKPTDGIHARKYMADCLLEHLQHSNSSSTTAFGQHPTEKQVMQNKSSTPTSKLYAARHHPALVQQTHTSRIIGDSTASSVRSNQHATCAHKSTAAVPSIATTSSTLMVRSAYEDKLEAAKRKLHLGYEHVQEAKRQHTICILRPDQVPLPRPAPKKPTMSSSSVCKGIIPVRRTASAHKGNLRCLSKARVSSIRAY